MVSVDHRVHDLNPSLFHGWRVFSLVQPVPPCDLTLFVQVTPSVTVNIVREFRRDT